MIAAAGRGRPAIWPADATKGLFAARNRMPGLWWEGAFGGHLLELEYCLLEFFTGCYKRKRLVRVRGLVRRDLQTRNIFPDVPGGRI